jgi:CTP synthase (UTP-ammonia lyase)
MKSKIAVIGEYYDSFEPHTSLNHALDNLRGQYSFDYEWLETTTVEEEKDALLSQYTGVWSAPGSPFKSLDGALYAISYARSNGVPHLGTCAGFQHAMIDIARNVLGIEEAQHEEYDTQASRLFISKLVCSLAGKTMDVHIKHGTLTQRLYGLATTKETYYCNFAINPEFRDSLDHPQVTVSGTDQDNEIRIIELKDHEFFIVTLFVPQTSSRPGAPHPLIQGFVDASCTK